MDRFTYVLGRLSLKNLARKHGKKLCNVSLSLYLYGNIKADQGCGLIELYDWGFWFSDESAIEELTSFFVFENYEDAITLKLVGATCKVLGRQLLLL